MRKLYLLLLLLVFFQYVYTQQVFVTGDIHGTAEYRRLIDVKQIQPGDCLIVLGDFGLVLSRSNEEKNALQILETQPYTILFVDGNHENFDMLEQFPEETLFGGKVRRINDNVFWLQRGEVFTISGKTFFVFGGGYSADYKQRTPGLSWWAQEAPSAQDKKNALHNLKKVSYTVDYILTHVPYYSLQVKMSHSWSQRYPQRRRIEPEPDPCAKFLDHIRSITTYTFWYNGHFHFTGQMDEKQSFVFRDIIQVF